MGVLVQERRRPGEDRPAAGLDGWSEEEVEEAFRALVATLLDTPTDVVRPGPHPPVPPRPPVAVAGAWDRRPPRRERSPP